LNGRRGPRDVFETLCGRNVLELLELLNGRRLLLRIRLESVRGNGEAVRGTGVSGKDVADEIVMIHSTQKGVV